MSAHSALTFSEMENVGTVRYLVNYCTGKSFHNDGSLFVDVRTFSNKRVKAKFIKSLIADGYKRS